MKSNTHIFIIVLYSVYVKLKIDTCSLIELQKLSLIPIIHEMYGPLHITTAVYNELINDALPRNRTFSEKFINDIEKKTIQLIDYKGILTNNLGKGEAETIAEVKKETDDGEEVLFVTEDKKAKQISIQNHLNVLSVDFLLVQACIEKKISEFEFDKKLMEFDSFHKLNLIRITELRKYISLFKIKKGEN